MPPLTLPRYWRTVAVFVSMTALQLVVAVASIETLSTVRAYVSGESLYSKGQMNAQMHLLNYAQWHREEDYQTFTEALKIPDGDRLARESLQKSPPDIEAARRGLLAGGNSDEDIDGAIRLFLWFHDFPGLATAIETWTHGDQVIARMRGMADAAHAKILAGQPNAPEVTHMMVNAPKLNQELIRLESEFGRELGEASRKVQQFVLSLNVLIAIVLTAFGIAFVRRSQHIQEAVQAEAAASMAKSAFLSRMSHELRTPLNAVIGFAQLLRFDAVDPLSKQQRERVQHVEVAGEHLLALVNEVLDLSRIETGKMSVALDAVWLAEVVDEAVTLVSPQVTKAGVEVYIGRLNGAAGAVPPGARGREVWVKADRLRLRQILVNLLSNSVKYNRPGGQVWIDWSQTEEACIVRVIDNGEGIAADKLTELFEPFNRLGAEHSRIEGTGIGLVLSRQLAEMMGGRLQIDSEWKKGTTATLELQPGAAPNAPLMAAVPTGTGQNSLRRRLNVLYAEDNEVNAELVRQLMNLRPEVILRVAESGNTALEMANMDPPDLFLVDMNLGDMTGIELACALREDRATRDVRLVALSADALPAQIETAMRNGFSRYLTKPINFTELLDLIDEQSTEPA